MRLTHSHTYIHTRTNKLQVTEDALTKSELRKKLVARSVQNDLTFLEEEHCGLLVSTAYRHDMTDCVTRIFNYLPELQRYVMINEAL